ncbi:30S ribosomal protein S18 [Candidatus Microgenomates bacterium]|nr:MAG: 30S ribosomal protein S18 [Candidatus Microgenomates bacterium]
MPKPDFELSYKNYEKLAKYMSDRARIYDRKRTGLSAKGQRRLTLAIKHARHLGLLPFKASI